MAEWNSAVRLHDRLIADLTPLKTFEEHMGLVLELLGTTSLIVLFNTVKTLGQWLSDPYGADATDYDLDFDLKGLWEEAQEAVANMADTPRAEDLAARMGKQAAENEPFLNAARSMSRTRAGRAKAPGSSTSK